MQVNDHGYASAGAIARYYELRERLRNLYRADEPDTTAIAHVLDELEVTHRYFKRAACGEADHAPAH